jgi:hypothetical protein
MTKKLLIFFCINFSFTLFSTGQINWNEIAPEAFKQLDQEISDTIAQIRKRSESYREEIFKLIKELEFSQDIICGVNNKFCREGMHKNFISPPVVLEKHRLERNEDVYRLESNHVALYFDDAKLFKWLYYKKQLENHKARKSNILWLGLYRQMPDDEKFNPSKPEEGIEWIKSTLICELVLNDKDLYLAKGPTEFKDFKPRLKKEINNLKEFKDIEWTFPFPKEALIFSFPYPGQFAFDLTEPMGNTGYLVFPDDARNKIMEETGFEKPLKARWLGNNGDIFYTDVHIDYYDGIIFFKIPTFLKPEFIYNFQLIILPDNYTNNDISPKECQELFRGNSNPKKTTLKELEGEKLVISYYFRVAKYALNQKNKTMEGTLDYESGELYFETDEPLDPKEIYGGGFTDPIVSIDPTFKRSHTVEEVIVSNGTYYYFQVPEIEQTEGVPVDQLLKVELDHTWKNGILQKLEYSAASIYNPLPENKEEDIPIANGYLAPKFKRYGVEDSLTCEDEIPFIDEKLFKKDKPLKFPVTKCRLKVGEITQLKNNIALLQKQLERRIEERSKFFLELEKRNAQREGKVLDLELLSIRNEEIENLSKNLKFLKELDFKELLKEDLIFYYSRHFPGTNNSSCNLSIRNINVQ